MKLTTVFLDAGGVILDESEHEQAIARVAVEVLSGVVEGYTLEAYWQDVAEASRIFAPRIYQYIFYCTIIYIIINHCSSICNTLRCVTQENIEYRKQHVNPAKT